MTIAEAITNADSLCPNQYDTDQKIAWLSMLDGAVVEEILNAHEGAPKFYPVTAEEAPDWEENTYFTEGGELSAEEPEDWEESFGEYYTRGFPGYDEGTDRDTELLIPAPYSEVYIWYLIRQIDLFNAEISRYNNSNAMYNNIYLTYSDWYTRTHRPISRAGRFRI